MKTEITKEIAENLSRIGHPLFISPLLGLVFLLTAGVETGKALEWTGLGIMIGIVPITTFLRIHPDYSLRTVANRENRKILYSIGLAEIIIFLGLVKMLEGPEVLFAGTLGILAATAVCAGINYRTKISVHVSTICGVAAAIIFYSLEAGLSAYLFAVLIGWSRIRIDRHTPFQVVLGFIVPTAVMTSVLWLLL